jgi:hypothetical protein
MPEGRQTEIWGSIAAAYGRLYFMAEDGVYCLGDAAAGNQAGRIKVTLGGKEAVSRVRVFSPLPWSFDFEDGKVPAGWVAAGRFSAGEGPGGKTLHKAPAPVGLNRSTALIGPADMKGYTIEADLKGQKRGRRMPDIGLVNAGYTLDLQGNHQRLQVRSWASELDFSKQVDFAWVPDTWYRIKLRVEQAGDTSRVRGKVWKRDGPEPAAWTVEYDDASGIGEGAPGVYADSPTNVDMDNLKVVVNR